MGALTARLELSGPVRMVLASLLVAAGAIHLAMVPSHAGSSNVEGITFAIAGSVQLLLGLAVAQRPSLLVLGGAAAVSVACIVAWVVSRTTGLPYGAHRGVAEAATVVDVTTVVFEFAALVVLGALALAPKLGESWPHAAVAMASIVPVVVLVLTADALSSPGALDHGSVESTSSAAVGSHLHGGGAASTAGAATFTPVAAPPEDPLDDESSAKLEAQLTEARSAAARVPTIADAEQAGMYDATSSRGGLLRYYVAPANQPHASDPGFDAEHPLVFLYAGVSGRSSLVGVAYIEFSERGPRGFAGPDDRWRLLTGLCSEALPGGGSQIVSIDADVSPTDCTALDGTYADSIRWMLHAWVAPGWENPEGVFRESNARVECVTDALLRWLDTARGTFSRPGAEATDALTADLDACEGVVPATAPS